MKDRLTGIFTNIYKNLEINKIDRTFLYHGGFLERVVLVLRKGVIFLGLLTILIAICAIVYAGIFSDLESFHMWLDQNALMKQEQKREQKRQEQEGVKVKEEPESCEAAEQGSVKSEAEEREEQVQLF